MTDMIKADEVVLKTDKLGRMQTPAARREQVLDEFERSGLSGKKFAALIGVKSVRWLEAVVEPNRGDQSPLVLELPGGAKVEIKNAQQAALAGALLRSLAKSC
jgi:hypothetical protein